MFNMCDWYEYRADVFDGIADGCEDSEEAFPFRVSADNLRRKAILYDLGELDAFDNESLDEADT